MTYIFIDTNIFLHFNDIQDIDWLKEANCEACKLIIPPIVLDELDKKKVGNSRVSNKARKILNKLEELSELENIEIQKNVYLEVLLWKPSKITYEKHDLNFDEQDERLLASILQFQGLISDNSSVLLCTNDVGPRLRSRRFGITALKLDDKYLMPAEISEEEKKNKVLQHELMLLKSKIPKLSICFPENKSFIKLERKDVLDNLNDEKTFKLKEIKDKLPYQFSIDDEEERGVSLRRLLSPSKDQINDYNKALDKYFLKCEKILDLVANHKSTLQLTYGIRFLINNSGNCPAEDIDIHLRFPANYNIVQTSKLPNPPQLPEPPELPKGTFFRKAEPLDFLVPKFERLTNPQIDIDSLSTVISKDVNKTYIDYHIRNLKHGYDEKLKHVSIIFSSDADIENFSIDYIISAANIPEKINGTLNVIFN